MFSAVDVLPQVETGESDVIEEVIVTAQKREQMLSEIPFALQALPGDELQKRGVTHVNDVVRMVPGATFTQSLANSGSVITLRNVGAYSRGEPTAASYVDEVPFSLPGLAYSPSNSMFDLERVEIIRSPQGTLYGQGAMGGVIKMITAEPNLTDGFSGVVKATGTRVKDGESGGGLDLSLNIPIVDDKLGARIVVSSHDYGGWLESSDFPSPAGGEDINDSDSLDVRAKLLYEPNDDLTIKLSYWHNETNEFFGNQAFPDPQARSYDFTFGGVTQNDVDFDIYSGFVRYIFGETLLEYSLSQMDWTTFIPGAVFGLEFLGDDEVTATTNELRILSNGDGPFSWVAGIHHREADRDGFLFVNISGNDFSTTDSEAIAVFGEASYSFLDGFAEVLVGMRWFEDERDYTQLDVANVFTAASETYDAISPRFNISLRPSDDGMIYFNAAKGFRSGLINPSAVLSIVDPTFANDRFTDSDELWTYEIGGKWDFLDGDLYAELTYYYTEWEDVQLQVNFGGGIAINNNIGDVEIKGLEYGLTYRTPIDGLTRL